MVGRRVFGLIGRGISHSFSADFFNKKFEKEGIDAVYINFDLPDISALPELIESNPAIEGLNVTAPYKRDVIPYLDAIDDDAEVMQAVNVISFHRDIGDKLFLMGHNTDSYGFGKTLRDLPPREYQAAVLGTGGASSAVCNAFIRACIPYISVSRTPRSGVWSYEQFNERIDCFNLIVNATPLGMYPHVEGCPPVDFSRVNPESVFYDLIYNPPQTLFLKRAAEQGAVTFNGLPMLINQAQRAWDYWK